MMTSIYMYDMFSVFSGHKSTLAHSFPVNPTQATILSPGTGPDRVVTAIHRLFVSNTSTHGSKDVVSGFYSALLTYLI